MICHWSRRYSPDAQPAHRRRPLRPFRTVGVEERRHHLCVARLRQPQQEIGELIEGVRRRAAAQRGRAAVEREDRHLRLVVIQVVVLHVEAELHVVRALGPTRVGAELHLVVGVVAHLARRHQRPRAHVEHRGRAVARSRRLAGVGDREVVAPAFVFRSLRSDPAVIRRVAEHTVDDERLGQDGGGKHRSARDVGLPEAADALRVELGAVERRKDTVAVLPAPEPADAGCSGSAGCRASTSASCRSCAASTRSCRARSSCPCTPAPSAARARRAGVREIELIRFSGM